MLRFFGLKSPICRGLGFAGSVALAVVAAGCDVPPDDVSIGEMKDAGVDSTPNNDAAIGATDSGTDGGDSIPADYSIVVLPDTQYYAAAFPEIFLKQTSWIVE